MNEFTLQNGSVNRKVEFPMKFFNKTSAKLCRINV